MRVTLELQPEMEQRVREEATARGQAPAELLHDMLNQVLIRVAELPHPRQKQMPSQLPRRRIAGLNRGQMQMADDFDAPLPDSFWMGSDE